MKTCKTLLLALSLALVLAACGAQTGQSPMPAEEPPAQTVDPASSPTAPVTGNAVPAYFPEDVLPLFKLDEVLSSSDNNGAIVLTYLSSGEYSEVFDYYHELLLNLNGNYIKQNLSSSMQGLVALIPNTDRSVFVILSNGAVVNGETINQVAVVVTVASENAYHETNGTLVEQEIDIYELFIDIGNYVDDGQFFIFSLEDMTISLVDAPDVFTHGLEQSKLINEAIDRTVVYIHEKLGLPDELRTEMRNTPGTDDKRSETSGEITVTWSYGPRDSGGVGLYIVYSLLQ